MTPDDEPLTPEERRVRDALRGLPAAPADPAFRARMRAGFVAGRASAPAGRSRRWWLLAASILVVGGSVVTLTRPQPWRIVAGPGTGFVTIDGERVALAGVSRLAGRLVGGVHVVTDAESELQLQAADAAVLVVTAGSDVRLPSVPGRWFGRSGEGAVARGELRGTTGPAFAGVRWHLTLPDAAVEITGTTFAVLRTDEGSCVCVLDGQVLMATPAARSVVEPGRRLLLAGPTATPLEEALRPMEQMKLEMLRETGRALLAGGR